MRTHMNPRSLMRAMQHRPLFSDHPLWWSELQSAKDMQWLRVNTSETADAYLVEMLAPGINKDAFELKVDGNRLKVKANSSRSTSKKEQTVLRMEFEVHSFERIFEMPEDVQASEIKARYESGILHLTLPKKTAAPDAEPQRIEVT